MLFILSQILLNSFNNIIKSHENYDNNIAELIKTINEYFNIDVHSYVKTQTSEINISIIAEKLFDAVSNIVSSTLMILLFAVFIFIEEIHLSNKLDQIFVYSPKKLKKINATLFDIEWSVARYLGIKTLISLLTGFLSYVVFLFFNICLILSIGLEYE